jgi:PqqD family protein of HPr-rel-A system
MADLPPNSSLPSRRDLTARRVGDEVLLRDPTTGQIHFLNATAAVVWECCDGTSTLSDCEGVVRERFDIHGDTDVAGDIRSTLADFRQRGLIDAAQPAS